MEGIRAASVYAEADFRINQSAYRNIDRFEKKIDKLKKKLDSLSSPNISVGGRVGGDSVGGGGGRSYGGGRSGEGWYWNTIGKVAYNMRKREAMVESAMVGMKNTFRTLKLPQEQMDRLNSSVGEFGQKLKSGEMISAEFAVQMKRLKSEARDLHKALNIPPPKYTTGINKGIGPILAGIAKKKYQQEGVIGVKRSQFERTLNELNVDIGSSRGKKYLNMLNGINKEFSDTNDINRYRRSIASLELEMRKAGRGGMAGFADKLRSTRANLLAMAAVATGAASFGLVKLGQEVNRTKMMMNTAFGAESAKELRFVRKESDALGVSFTDAARAWAKLGLTSDIGGFSRGSARGLFKGMMDMSVAMGLSTEQLALSFHALTQAYTKGALTSEDLQGQLAEHIPGIVPMIKKELGFGNGNDEAFFDALKKKEIKPDQFAEGFARAFSKYTKDFKNLPEFQLFQKEGQFKNAIKDLATAFTTGAGPGLVLALDNLVFLIKNTLPVWKFIGAVIGTLTGVITTIPRMMMAVVHDLYYYLMGDENVRKELHEYFGMKYNPSSGAGVSKGLMASLASSIPGTGPAAIASVIGESVGKYISDAFKGSMKIEILPSPDFVARTSGNNPWPVFNASTP